MNDRVARNGVTFGDQKKGVYHFALCSGEPVLKFNWQVRLPSFLGFSTGPLAKSCDVCYRRNR